MTLIIQSQSSLDAGWFRSLCSMFSHPSAYVREQLHHKLSEDLNSLKNEYAFFVYFFLFILSPSSQLWYNAADSSKKYNTDETETQKLFISWRCRGNFSVMIKFRQLLTLLTTNTVVLRMTGGLVGGNQTSNFFPESSRCAGQRSVLLLSCDSRDQSICMMLLLSAAVYSLMNSCADRFSPNTGRRSWKWVSSLLLLLLDNN